MGVAADLLELLDAVSPADLPAATALIVPPTKTPGKVAGEFCAVALADGSVGLSYLLLGDTFERVLAAARAPLRFPMPVRELTAGLLDTDPVRRTVGMAAVNAASQHILCRGGFVGSPDDSLGQIAPAQGQNVGMVGLFPPLVRRIVAAGAVLTVIELRRDLVGLRDGYRVVADPAALADCDKVIVTSTTILNDTLDDVLRHCGKAIEIVVIGPGAGCLPDPLFARGVTAIGATRIVDPVAFAGAVSAGAPWGSAASKYLIRRSAYPGASVLARAWSA